MRYVVLFHATKNVSAGLSPCEGCNKGGFKPSFAFQGVKMRISGEDRNGFRV